jgi:hypothetical protein
MGSAQEPDNSSYYLSMKNTCREVEVGGALVGQAATSPLLVEIPKTSASLAASFCPVLRRQEDVHGHRQVHALSHKTSFAPGQPASQVSPLVCQQHKTGQPRDHLGSETGHLQE